MSGAPPTRVSGHFPAAPAPCSSVAATFFACFDKQGAQATGGGAGLLAACEAEMKAYDACMTTKGVKRATEPIFRVQESYRRGAGAAAAQS
jgi:hypothetical protein